MSKQTGSTMQAAVLTGPKTIEMRQVPVPALRSGDDPLMVAYHAVKQSNFQVHDKALVIGTGLIGYLMGHLLRIGGASTVALSYASDRRLPIARELGDFDSYFDGTDPDRM